MLSEIREDPAIFMLSPSIRSMPLSFLPIKAFNIRLSLCNIFFRLSELSILGIQQLLYMRAAKV